MRGEGLEDALAWNLGRYTLHGEIAAGGMASVHIGRLEGTAGFTKTVAIKRLHAQFAKDPEFVSMFLDEARLAARIHHPNVVQPLDVISTDGEVFLVMEYIRGESLSRIQRFLRPTGARIPLKVVGAIIVGILHGLHAAHEASNERGEPLGIVHRDVSPQNVIVGTDGVARVLDFGIAKAANRSQNTQNGDLKGKLPYMAPEQLLAETEVDRRTDIYAASIVLWELLVGERLFDSDYQSAILKRASQQNSIQAPSDRVPNLPKALDDAVMKGLSRDPNDRFKTAREMAIQLEMVMPLATPSKVGEWVELVAGESLAKRAARIKEIEQERPLEIAMQEARGVIDDLAKSQSIKARPSLAAKEDSEPRSLSRVSSQNDESADRAETVASSAPTFVPVSRASQVAASDRTLPPASSPPRRVSLPPPMPSPESRRSPPSMRNSAPPPPPSVRGAPPPSARAVPPPPDPISVSSVMIAPESVPNVVIAPDEPAAYERRRPAPPPRPSAAEINEVPALPPNLSAPAVGEFSLADLPPPSRNVIDLHGEEKKKGGGAGLFGLLVLVGGLVAFYLSIPIIVRRACIDGAARAGIELTVGDLQVELHQIHLTNVSAKVSAIPGLYMRAGEVSIDLRGVDAEQIVLTNVETTIDGTFPTMRDAFNRWLASHPVKQWGAGTAKVNLARIRIASGRVVWSRIFGDNTKVDFAEVSGEMARKEEHLLGEDFFLTSNSFAVGTPLGAIGPYKGQFSHEAASTSASMSFNPATNDAGGITYVDQENGGMELQVNLPRALVEKVGVPKAMLGIPIDESLQVEGNFHFTRRTPTKVEVEASATLYGLKLAGAAAGVDVKAGLKADGDPREALEVSQGVVLFGAFKARLGGKATFLRDGFRFDLTWRSAPRACSLAAQPDPSLNVLQFETDMPSLLRVTNLTPGPGQTVVQGTFVLDSRDLSQTRIVAAPATKCGSKIFAP
jgi:serine/threonine protein kinase